MREVRRMLPGDPDRPKPSGASRNSRRAPGEASRHFSMQISERSLGAVGQNADHDVGSGPHSRQRLGADGLQAAANSVAHHCRADLAAHDESEARRSIFAGVAGVRDDVRARATTTPADDGLVIRSAGESVRPSEHRRRVRPRARCAPWSDERRGCCGRRECAYGHGNHASWRGGGCWAGTCAWS